MKLSPVLLVLFAGCVSSYSNSGPVAGVYELPAPADMTAGSFSAMDHIFQNKKIVQLGEGLHMTREFPLARTALAKRLAEKHGFDIILFEGSVIDAWLASDLVLNAKKATDTDFSSARNIAFPSIWHAPEYTEIFKGPFYVASYDLQPGMGSLKAQSIPQFLRTLAKYAQPSGGTKQFDILEGLSDRKTAYPNFPVKNEDEYRKAISMLKPWLSKVALKVEKKFPGSLHSRVLKVIPTALECQLELWKAHQGDTARMNFKTFQETRDRLAAKMIVLMTKEVSKSGKAMVWAHHVHVFHNHKKLSRHSLGADLKAALGDSVYTVGLFANEGEIWALTDMEDVVEGPIAKAAVFDVESKLLKVSKGRDIFVDFSELGKSAGHSWVEELITARPEGNGKMKVVPAKDFDAAIFLQRVSKPKLPWSK